MPFSQFQVLKEIVPFVDSLTPVEIKMLERDPYLQVLQTSGPVEPETWRLLNQNLFAKRPEIKLRVYGYYPAVCDLSFLPLLSNVRHFAADCLTDVGGVEYLSSLTNIESLSIGVDSLKSFNFLSELPEDSLQQLTLGATKSKLPSLDVIERFKNLKTLYINGHQKKIEVISSLSSLEVLTLRSVSPENLDFIRNLRGLWSLAIKLGGIQDFSALEGLNQIKYLELWQIRKLSDIRFISEMLGLQFIFLQALCNVISIPDLSQLAALRRIYLEDMKGLKDITALTSASSLEELIHVSARGMNPEDYEGVLKMKSLRKATVGFGSLKKNESFREIAAKNNVEIYEHTPFNYTE